MQAVGQNALFQRASDGRVESGNGFHISGYLHQALFIEKQTISQRTVFIQSLEVFRVRGEQFFATLQKRIGDALDGAVHFLARGHGQAMAGFFHAGQKFLQGDAHEARVRER